MTSPWPDDAALAADMRDDAEQFAAEARELGFRLDYSPESIREVERTIVDETTETDQGPVVHEGLRGIGVMVGAYVGEVFVRSHGWSWSHEETPNGRTPGVRSPDGRVVAFVLDKAIRRMHEPIGNDLDYFCSLFLREADEAREEE